MHAIEYNIFFDIINKTISYNEYLIKVIFSCFIFCVKTKKESEFKIFTLKKHRNAWSRKLWKNALVKKKITATRTRHAVESPRYRKFSNTEKSPATVWIRIESHVALNTMKIR